MYCKISYHKIRLVSFIVGKKAKGRISKRMYLRKTNIFYHLIRTRMCVYQRGKKRTCAYQEVRNVRFFWKFGVLCFLETPVLRFALSPYYRSYTNRHHLERLNTSLSFFAFAKTASSGNVRITLKLCKYFPSEVWFFAHYRETNT